MTSAKWLFRADGALSRVTLQTPPLLSRRVRHASQPGFARGGALQARLHAFPTVAAMTAERPITRDRSPTTRDQTWAALRGHGGAPWQGLLPAASDPLAATLDSELRAELMRCGHFAAACPDAFQGDVSSLQLGTCIYPWTQLAIGQQDADMNKVLDVSIPQYSSIWQDGYYIQDYLYANSGFASLSTKNPMRIIKSLAVKWGDTGKDPNRANWVGFCAVSKPLKDAEGHDQGVDVVLSWRGTRLVTEWTSNIEGDWMVPWTYAEEGKRGIPMVHNGFRAMYCNVERDSRIENSQDDWVPTLSPQQKVRELLEGLTAKMKVRSITVTGHSLGGALTTLCACDIGEWLRDNRTQLGPDPPLCNAVTWASPRVGNEEFKQHMASLSVPVLRIVNRRDLVPQIPGLLQLFGTTLALQLNYDPEVSFAGRAYTWLTTPVLRTVLRRWAYVHVGERLLVDTAYNTLIAEGKRKNPFDAHNLQGYIYMVAAQYRGLPAVQPTQADLTAAAPRAHGGDTAQVVRQDVFGITGSDPALINKVNDAMDPLFGTPAEWFQLDPMRGLQQDAHGLWQRRAHR